MKYTLEIKWGDLFTAEQILQIETIMNDIQFDWVWKEKVIYKAGKINFDNDWKIISLSHDNLNWLSSVIDQIVVFNEENNES